MTGLYLHIPFCTHKCHYCDFYSLATTGNREAFVEALLVELKLRAESISSEISTIFFGGGTPSLLTSSQMGSIFESIHKYYSINQDAEITVECNPGTVDFQKFSAYKNLGINRISLGVQSFNLQELKFLQRIHCDHEPEIAVELARDAGIDNISLDLMFGVPGQNIQSLENSIRRALGLKPLHISSYNLIYEQGTPLNFDLQKGRIKRLDPDLEAEMYDLSVDLFRSSGYEHYEVSNYAQPGRKCRHNLIYWHGGEYLGFGPSAHGFIGMTRYWNIRSLNKYISLIKDYKLPQENSETINSRERLTEMIMLGLRAEGIDIAFLEETYDINLSSRWSGIINDLIGRRHAVKHDNILRLTDSGYFISDDIILRLARALD